jgi:hypothetical protein
MRFAEILGLLVMVTAVPLYSDWKVTTVRTFGKGRAISTDYYKNGMRRSDIIDPATGQVRSVTVLDDPGMRSLSWDVERREYSIRRLRARPRASESNGPALAIDIESTDTGERRTMFGREVRRVITLERRQTEGGPKSESRTDGWYLESDSLPPAMRARTGVLLGAVYGQAPPGLKINRRGLVEKGLPILATTTMTNTRADRHLETKPEVTELFEGQLDPALFEPPPGFRRVFRFDNFAATWQDGLLLPWGWLQDWLAGLRR